MRSFLPNLNATVVSQDSQKLSRSHVNHYRHFIESVKSN